MPAGSGDERQTTMSVDLGGEQVVLERAVVREALSEPFEISIDILSQHVELDLRPHLGKPIKVKVTQAGEVTRLIHGHIIEGMFVNEAKAGWRYRLTVRPWTYMMDANVEYRIYQQKTVKQILEETFKAAKQPDVDMDALTSERVKRTYCVQYGESDFDFASRLMEEEGIYYYFRHEEDRHVMVLCEGTNSHKMGTPETLKYNADSRSMIGTLAGDATVEPFVTNWMERLRTSARGKVTVRDWDFRKPQDPIAVTVEESSPVAVETAEVYMGASTFVLGESDTNEKVANPKAGAALSASRANDAVYTGMSQSLGLAVGRKVKVAGHHVGRFDGEYLITGAQHTIVSEKHRSGDESPSMHGFDVAFEAIPATTVFRPQVRTPRPAVRGLESAVVTGPPGEVIHTDEYGRVKVQFHWDRIGKKDDNSSCWIRVSQTGGLGNLILPRIGHEVLVDFLGGDPDRPLVVGRVFNAEHMPIYALPENRNVATWRSETVGSPGDIGAAAKIFDERELAVKKGAVESNEIRMDDSSGKEEFYMHANRDMNTRVRHKEMHRVGLDQEIFVGQDRIETVVRNEKVTITGKRDYTLTGNETEIIKEGNRTTTLDQGNRTTTLKVGNDELAVNTGNIKIHADAGKIEIEAMQSIELKVGMNTIKIDQTGVTVKGMMIASEAQTTHTVKGLMTTTEASTLMTVKGTLTMIN